MAFKQFVAKQFIDVIQWNEPDEGVLAYRFPMEDQEIQTGAQLTVRESQMALFVNEGKIADIFGPGLYTLNTQNLPLLTDLKNWDKEFKSPFKSDVYFFATRLQIDQRWGTGAPIIIRDKEFGAVSMRAYGVYSYHVTDCRTFFTRVSGTLGTYRVSDMEGQLRAMIIACITEVVANSAIPFLDMTANLTSLTDKLGTQIKPAFTAMGLELSQFVVQSISLPDDLQQLLDQRTGMRMVGDLGHYTQFAAAESLPIAAANTSGAADMGIGLGAGAAMGQVMMGSLKSAADAVHAFGGAPVAAAVAAPEPPPPGTAIEAIPAFAAPSASAPASHAAAPSAPAPALRISEQAPESEQPERRFCIFCGKQIPSVARFCPKCGERQLSLTENTAASGAASESSPPSAANPTAEESEPEERRFCIFCGKQIPTVARFCSKCGERQL